jgi:hypothetical protein
MRGSRTRSVRARTSSASSTARTSANGLRSRSSASSVSAFFARGSSRIAAVSARARSMLDSELSATAVSNSSASSPRPNSVLVSWSRVWSRAWSRCRSVPFGARLLVSEGSFSGDFRSVHLCAEGGSHFENRRTARYREFESLLLRREEASDQFHRIAACHFTEVRSASSASMRRIEPMSPPRCAWSIAAKRCVCSKSSRSGCRSSMDT